MLSISIPPLRERRDDIPALLEHFLGEARRRYPGAVARRLSADALALLRRHRWPGNVRELAHTVEKLVLLGAAEEIAVADLPEAVTGAPAAEPFDFRGEIKPLRELDRRYAAWALAQTGGHRGKTAEKLDVDPKTLRKLLGESERPQED